jgi:uncharacterized membrane protein YgcG
MNTQSKPTGLRTILIIAVIALFLLSGIGITGAAAQSAVPGDALYSVKTSIEQTRLSLAKDAGDRAQMKLSFAEQRMNEISVLVNEGRNREIKDAVLSFEASINGAIIEVETVAKGDPARAAELSTEITAALTRYAQTLSGLAAKAPDGIKDDLNRALGSAQLAGSLDMPTDDNSNSSVNENGDDNGNDNANVNSNDAGDDHGNDNANVNSNDNGNDNANLNGNGSVDDHGNDSASMNANDNAEDRSNSNTSVNDNSNSNTNTSVDDNSNSNTSVDDNSNSNTSVDDNSNTNTSMDDNSNSNTNTSVDDNSNSNTNTDDSGGSGGNSGSGGGGDDSGGSNSGNGK